ncbi:hypothetical protein [Venenivibrio stagnispumantis]|nr:hypothetical protein [Venenivibrio stagnispumantis]MCW4573684.1 hypothetical protein [Venenivibrio stagnispumantis]
MINFKPVMQNIEFVNIVKPLGSSISLKSGETLKADIIDILPSGAVVVRLKDSFLTLKTEIPLSKDYQLLLKVLDTGNTDNKIKLQILDIIPKKSGIENLIDLLKNLKLIDEKENISNLPKLIENLLNSNDLSNQIKILILEEAIKNFEIKNIPSSLIQDILLSENIKNELLKQIESSIKESFKQKIENIPENVKNLFIDIKKLDENNIKVAIQNSGIFFEKKLSEGEVSQDLKYMLYLSENNELLQDIKNMQLYSYMTNSIFLFLPIAWNYLNYAFFQMKKQKIDLEKESYLARLDLDLKDYGKLSVLIALFDKKDLYITFAIQNKNLEDKIRNNILELKKSLEDVNLISITFINKEPVINIDGRA